VSVSRPTQLGTFGAPVRKTKALPAGSRASKKVKDTLPRLCDSFRVVNAPVTVRLGLPPKLNHYYRTAVVCGHAQTYISKEGRDYRDHVIAEWRRQTGGVTFEGRLAMRVEIVYRDLREGDMDGHVKALWDSLEHAGAYRNDSQIRLLIVEQQRVEAPGWVEVKIGPKPGREEQSTLFACDW
jgi:crossover junction endodeoxyribonuclease RusA